MATFFRSFIISYALSRIGLHKEADVTRAAPYAMNYVYRKVFSINFWRATQSTEIH